MVPLESADPGFGKFIPVDADHLHVCKHGSKDEFAYTMTVDFIKETLARKKMEKAVERAIFVIEKGWQMTDAVETKEAAATMSSDAPVVSEEETELTELMLTCCR